MNESSIDCKQFESKFDAYVDAALDPAERARLAAHVRCCSHCDKIVTRYQEARALLTTAVAEQAAAVDVSGLWESIEQRLDPLPEPVGLIAASLAAVRRWLGADSPWSVVGWRAGAFAAAAAAVALVVSFAMRSSDRTQVAAAEHMPAVRIDSMEVAAGHTVSTWVRPRRQTQVIWVSDGGNEGFGFSNASHRR